MEVGSKPSGTTVDKDTWMRRFNYFSGCLVGGFVVVLALTIFGTGDNDYGSLQTPSSGATTTLPALQSKLDAARTEEHNKWEAAETARQQWERSQQLSDSKSAANALADYAKARLATAEAARAVVDAPRMHSHGHAAYLFLVAMGGLAAGMGVGFLYSTFGKESDTFSSYTKFLNGFASGALITDVTKSDGIVRRALQGAAVCCAMPGCSGIIALVFASFAALGFFFVYVNKTLTLNLFTADTNSALDDIEKRAKREQVDQGVRLSTVEPGEKPAVTGDVRKAADELVNDPNVGRDESLDALKADAKALYVAGKLADAEAVLRKATTLYPNDSDALMYLGNVLLAEDKPAEAVPYLERLKGRPGARSVFWKLLGYALLYDPTKLKESAEATRAYLATNPDDLGAKINLACALAPPGPTNNPNHDEVIRLLTEVAKDPSGKARIIELTRPGKDADFIDWVNDPAFKPLIQ